MLSLRIYFEFMVKLSRQLVKEIIDWDVENWKHTLNYWNALSFVHEQPLKCLELGGRRGGMSLWLATLGHHVICSDIENPQDTAMPHHTLFQFEGTIEYAAINAIEIPYENEFDLIVFKSIMGGVSRNGNDHLQQQCVDACYKALKPGGVLLFAENTTASCLHQFARKRFVKHGNSWNYLKLNNVPKLFASWSKYECKTIGFWGTFGRTERQRTFLGKIDRVVHYFIPKKYRYIAYGKAIK